MADMTSSLPLPGAQSSVEQDYGFGRILSEQHGYRLLNRDGSYNVQLDNASPWSRFFSYYTFISISWPKFFAIFAMIYLAVVEIFAFFYVAAGPNQLSGAMDVGEDLRAFFFSVHTLATVGYGNISPVGTRANVIVTFESFASWTLFALFAGLIFARFSRPVAGIVFSKDAVIAPYGNGTAFEFRLVNSKCNPLFNLEALVVLSRFEQNDRGRERKFHPLKLERDKVAFFPLNWTVVHAIDKDSPLWGWNKQMLIEAEAEFFILITAMDDTYSQQVNKRASYTAREVEFGRKFKMMYEQKGNKMVLDLAKLDATEKVSLPA
jgi:inward rectifier potassium channel